MFLSQVLGPKDEPWVVARTGSDARIVKGVSSVYDLAMAAIDAGHSMADEVAKRGLGDAVDLEKAAATGRLQLPIMHPDAAHLHLTGTGLTHLGSAATRDSMHAVDPDKMTDSMKMFRMGLEGGKPTDGEPGAQPEWFYKGNGTMAVAPGQPLTSPGFCGDAGEEPELAGVYVIAKDGTPYRLGFALGNEFSDHVTEKVNYLWLAHSKLRQCSFGPEIRVGDAPADVRGTSRIIRDNKTFWEKPFASGEANMSHSLANLEHHHFKYGVFCQPGDVHVHFFGTATLSVADGIKTENGDIFEISSPEFGLPLRNALKQLPAKTGTVKVKTL